ncbi:MAG: GHKL domain-containing protein [Ruminococcus sp.]|nr:GHKL domain-containing protein [Ruminococcus sp.]
MNTFLWSIEFLATFCEVALNLIFCGTFIEKNTDSKRPLKKFIASVVVAVLIIFLNQIELYSYMTVLFNLCLIVLMSMIVYPKNKIKIFILCPVFCTILSTIDNIVVYVISYTTHIESSEIFQEMSLYRVLAITTSKTFLLFFVIVINKIYRNKKILKNKYLVLLLIITPVLLIITISMTFIEMNSNKGKIIMSIVFFIIMFLFSILIFFGTFKLADYYENLHKLKLIELKNIMLEQSTNETKETFELIQNSLHDYKHSIIYLQTLADNNDIDGIKKCLSQQNDFLGKRLFYYKTGNDTVDAMLYIKQKSAESHNITFIINANIPEECPVSSEHFAVILGNLLDNATEASFTENNPFIEVRIKKLEEYFWIIVSNKCTNQNVSLKTSKPEKHLHGIGLNSVRHIVKHYNGELNIDTESEKFEVKIMIPL